LIWTGTGCCIPEKIKKACPISLAGESPPSGNGKGAIKRNADMNLEDIEKEMKKMVGSLDRGTRLEAVLKEEKEYRLILTKGTHSERAVIAEDLMEDFLERGKRGQEVKKAVGKVISMLTLMAQKRR
jgi:hypothetical protein